jgi:tetratricopeptide (TPR) repeat protein
MKKILLIALLLQMVLLSSGQNRDSLKTIYNSLLDEYRSGKMDIKKIQILVSTAEKLDEGQETDQIAADFINNHLSNLPDSVFFKKANLNFIYQHSQGFASKSFQRIYHHQLLADEVTGNPFFLRDYVDFLIAKEEIIPKLWPNKVPLNRQPNWNALEKTIAQKYSKNDASRAIVNAKIRWYEFKKDTVSLIYPNIQKIAIYGLDTSAWGRLGTNNMIYEIIFSYSTDKKVLNIGIKWMQAILRNEPTSPTPQYLDTYANLLYKVGRIDEAISIEAKALKEIKALKIESDNEDIQLDYEKMLARKPTWIIH